LIERELIALSRKAQLEPARLTPVDLEPLRQLVGDGALEYVLVLCSFHCITRVADLLGAEPETPAPLRRLEALRLLTIHAAGLWLRFKGLAGESYTKDYEQAVQEIWPVFERAVGRPPADDFEALSSRPQLVEAVQLILEEQLYRSSLSESTLSRVHRIVEKQLLPNDPTMTATQNRDDPIESFVVIGTRHPYRATVDSVHALRRAGLDDLAILDLALAIADANMWARYYRLLELSPELYYLSVPGESFSTP
jgi:hypothetical protein